MTWRLTVLPAEVHIRLPRLPGMRLDVTRTEAAALINELAQALEAPQTKVYRVSWWLRLKDWWTLRRLQIEDQRRIPRDIRQLKLSSDEISRIFEFEKARQDKLRMNPWWGS